ncbi:hypothetical protein [Pontibacter akesuensis]|nr:hypothetical protein [Pontibacter akesuensis]
MKTKLLLYSVMLLLSGCSLFDPCYGSDPAPIMPVSFYFTDNDGVNLVGDNGGAVHPDSVRVKSNMPPFIVNPSKEYRPKKGGFVFDVFPGQGKSGTTTYYIKLAEGFSDTLVVSYLVDNSGCFSSLEYTEFFHNGKEIIMEPETGYLQLVKE